MEVEEAEPASTPPAPANGMEEDAAAVAPPPNAKSAAHGSPLRLYTAHFLLGQPADDEGAEGAADAKLLHQYLYEHPNGLFIVGLAELHVAIQAARSGETRVSRIDFLPSFSTAKREDRALVAAMQEDGAVEGEGTEQGADEEEEQQPPAAAAAAAAVSAAVDGDGEARVAALVAGNRVAAGTRRGRKKNKGDLLVQAGTVLASVETADGRVVHVQCGVAGQILELNERVAANPSLLVDKPTTEGYLAIIQPPRFPSAKHPAPDRSSFVSVEEYRRQFGEKAVASLL